MRRFADFIKKPLDRVTPEDVRTFQLHLIQDKKLAYSTFSQAVWYLGTLIESAKGNEPQPAQPIQLHLPGFAAADTYLLDSF